jgi:antitoxin MazE
MSMPKSATLKIQRWGNSLAVRIPSEVARSAKLSAGQPVEVSVQEVGVAIVPIGPREMSLLERLHAFDPLLHGGEALVTRRIGNEAA